VSGEVCKNSDKSLKYCEDFKILLSETCLNVNLFLKDTTKYMHEKKKDDKRRLVPKQVSSENFFTI